jgi:hypothetical protein
MMDNWEEFEDVDAYISGLDDDEMHLFAREKAMEEMRRMMYEHTCDRRPTHAVRT